MIILSKAYIRYLQKSISDSMRGASLDRKEVRTRKIDIPKRNPIKITGCGESIGTGFNSTRMHFTPVLFEKHEKRSFLFENFPG